MSVITIEAARRQRLCATRAATHLKKISDVIDIKQAISADQFNRLPEWCSMELEQIRLLQRTCGALYFTPIIATSIDGRLLRALKAEVGDECFSYVRSQSNLTHKVNVDLQADRLPVALMAAGSGVLAATVSAPYLQQLFEQLIGPRSIVINPERAQKIITESYLLIYKQPMLFQAQ